MDGCQLRLTATLTVNVHLACHSNLSLAAGGRRGTLVSLWEYKSGIDSAICLPPPHPLLLFLCQMVTITGDFFAQLWTNLWGLAWSVYETSRTVCSSSRWIATVLAMETSFHSLFCAVPSHCFILSHCSSYCFSFCGRDCGMVCKYRHMLQFTEQNV